jgi:hypothetical protein
MSKVCAEGYLNLLFVPKQFNYNYRPLTSGKSIEHSMSFGLPHFSKMCLDKLERRTTNQMGRLFSTTEALLRHVDNRGADYSNPQKVKQETRLKQDCS